MERTKDPIVQSISDQLSDVAKLYICILAIVRWGLDTILSLAAGNTNDCKKIFHPRTPSLACPLSSDY